MFKHKLNESVSFTTYADWFLLSFLAGNINAGGFLACGRFVSHVTGFATLAGISLSEGNWLETIGILTIPGYFLAGVMVSGYLTEKRRFDSSPVQRYAPVMSLVAIFLAVATLAGVMNWFGKFGETSNLANDYFLLALLCGACGLQNAAISSASGSTIRTTHLTGLTTDLGLGLIRAEVHRSGSSEERTSERKANLLRVGTIFSFMLGSVIGAIVFSRFHFYGFILPMLLAVYASFKARDKPL
jgi:uncharacterized membrane protein YoaK (UPF0700 family)